MVTALPVKTTKEAERLLRDWLGQVETGSITSPARLTLEELLTRHCLENHAKRTLHPTTCDCCLRITRKHILPALGHHQVEKLTPAYLNRFDADLQCRKPTPGSLLPFRPPPGPEAGGKVAHGDLQPGCQADPPIPQRKEMQTLDGLTPGRDTCESIPVRLGHLSTAFTMDT